MRTSIRTKLLASVVAGAAIVGVAAGPAMAEDTTTTFELTAGALAVSVPASATITGVSTGTGSTASALGDVTVDDARGALLTAGWTATVSGSDFVTGNDDPASTGYADRVIAKANVSYNPGLLGGLLTSSGTAVRVPGTAGSLGSSRTAYSATGVVGNNVTTWNPTITVTIPSDAVAGAYSGVITHSVA